MLSLSPAKLLVILVIALIVLGPEKLPQVARQIGAAWHDLRQWRARLETEIRGTFPDLPPTHEVAQAVRSPLAFLDRLADEHERAIADEPATTTDPVVDGGNDSSGPAPPVDAAAAGAVSPVAAAPGPPGSGNGSGSTNGSGSANGAAVGNGAAAGNGAGADSPAGRAGMSVPGAFPAVPDDPSMN